MMENLQTKPQTATGCLRGSMVRKKTDGKKATREIAKENSIMSTNIQPRERPKTTKETVRKRDTEKHAKNDKMNKMFAQRYPIGAKPEAMVKE